MIIKIRGLRLPTAAWALTSFFVSETLRGRSRLSIKQGTVTGLGSALINETASSIVFGEPEMPAGGAHALVVLPNAELPLSGFNVVNDDEQPCPRPMTPMSSTNPAIMEFLNRFATIPQIEYAYVLF